MGFKAVWKAIINAFPSSHRPDDGLVLNTQSRLLAAGSALPVNDQDLARVLDAVALEHQWMESPRLNRVYIYFMQALNRDEAALFDLQLQPRPTDRTVAFYMIQVGYIPIEVPSALFVYLGEPRAATSS